MPPHKSLPACLAVAIFLAPSHAAVARGGANSANSLKAAITTTWDNKPINHAPINITLRGETDHLEISFHAPHFDWRDSTTGPRCLKDLFGRTPCPNLLEFEHISFIFLSESGGKPSRYAQISVGPWGHHMVQLASADGKSVAQGLPLEYQSRLPVDSTPKEKSGASSRDWLGASVKVPTSYFPPDVTKWNAFAMHKDGASPGGLVHEALYPATTSGKNDKPDFRRFQFFKPISFKDVFPAYRPSETSSTWKKAPTANSPGIQGFQAAAPATSDSEATTEPTEAGTDGTGATEESYSSSATEETAATDGTAGTEGTTATTEETATTEGTAATEETTTEETNY